MKDSKRKMTNDSRSVGRIKIGPLRKSSFEDRPHHKDSTMTKEIDSEKLKKESKKYATQAIKTLFNLCNIAYEYDKENSSFRTTFERQNMTIRLDLMLGSIYAFADGVLDLCAERGDFSKIALKLNEINRGLESGALYLNTDNGQIGYRYKFPYLESKLSPEFFYVFLKNTV